MLFKYAFIVGVGCSIVALVGLLFGKKTWALTACLASCFTASPIITFTRGAAGSIIASDIVGLTLLVFLILSPRFGMQSKQPYIWRKIFWFFVFFVCGSIIFVGPIYNFYFFSSIFKSRVQEFWVIPLPILMAGFRITKILTLIPFIILFSRIQLERKEFDKVMSLLMLFFVGLAVAEIMTRLSIYDLSLYVDPNLEYVGPRVLGFSKATIGRLCGFGVFLSMALMYRSFNVLKALIIIILLLGILFSGSRGALLIVLVGIAVIVIYGRLAGSISGFVAFASLALCAAIAYSLSGNVYIDKFVATLNPEKVGSVASRKDIWFGTIDYWFQHPFLLLTGVGAMNFSYVITSRQFIAEHAHNDFLTAITELGVIGLVLFCWLLVSVINHYRHGIQSTVGKERWENVCIFAALVGLIAAGFFETTFYITMGAIPIIRIIFCVLIMHENTSGIELSKVSRSSSLG